MTKTSARAMRRHIGSDASHMAFWYGESAKKSSTSSGAADTMRHASS